MTHPMKARLENLARRVSAAIGAQVDVTIRGPLAFTFSTDTVVADLGDRVAAFFGDLATVTAAHDEECGSFAYIAVNA